MFKNTLSLGVNSIPFDITQINVKSIKISDTLKKYNEIIKNKSDDTKEAYKKLNEGVKELIFNFISEDDYYKLINGYSDSYLYSGEIIKEIFETIKSQNQHITNLTDCFKNIVLENEDIKEDK